ncbi:MAG TPA: hypothetical protein VM491_16160 [Burkholderiaceae bacterium]|jgi:hypothetical protein|nr:hypothetical protein [Burkholderiaceae bacterium]
MLRWLAVVCLSIAVSPAWAQYRHYSVGDNDAAMPTRLVMIPARVKVHEMSAAGMLELVPDWTREASEQLTQAVDRFVQQRRAPRLVPLPELTEDERDQLDDYLATLMVVAGDAFFVVNRGGDAWSHKRERFDYSVGEGLEFLARKSGADGAMLIIGNDIVSSAGRKAIFIMGALAGVAIPMGSSAVYGAFVDLKTGNLLWINNVASGVRDLRDPAGAAAMIDSLLHRLPPTP